MPLLRLFSHVWRLILAPCVALGLWLALCGAVTASAASCIITALNQLTHPAHDSSVELEISFVTLTGELREEVLDLLTTSDGTVKGLLQPGESLPEWFVADAKQAHPHLEDPLALRWEPIPPKTRFKLLRDIARERDQSFFKDRVFHGLAVKKAVRLHFDQPTVFLGKSYAPGTHTVDVSSVLKQKVEFMSIDDIKELKGIEIHFRDRQNAGAVSRDAWKFLEGAEIPRTHQHVHIVAPLSHNLAQQDRVLHATLHGDFVRRANVAAEMITVVEEAGRIQTRNIDGVTYFDSFEPTDVRGVTKYFQDVGNGSFPKIGDNYKMGWVGMRGSDKYDTPDLWGIEVRAINSTSDSAQVQAFLDGLQYSMIQGDLGVNPQQMLRWLETQPKRRGAPEQVGRLYYNQEWENLFKEASMEVRKDLAGLMRWVKRRDLAMKGQNNREVKMLVFDWSKDPVVFEDLALRNKIVTEQRRAIDRILITNESVNEIMKDFLLTSGLYERVLRSVGAKVVRK